MRIESVKWYMNFARLYLSETKKDAGRKEKIK